MYRLPGGKLVVLGILGAATAEGGVCGGYGGAFYHPLPVPTRRVGCHAYVKSRLTAYAHVGQQLLL